MSIELTIPDSVVQAIRIPDGQVRSALLTELAVGLYAQGFLSLGKAGELAGLSRFEMAALLGKRGIPRHYGPEELDEDLHYARSQ